MSRVHPTTYDLNASSENIKMERVAVISRHLNGVPEGEVVCYCLVDQDHLSEICLVLVTLTHQHEASALYELALHLIYPVDYTADLVYQSK